MGFLATINTPGYMPWDDDPPVFETAAEAWEYLAEQRRDQEDGAICDDYCDDPMCQWRSEQDLTETVAELEARASSEWLVCDFERTGTVYADTPGYHGDHDLGLAYSVTEVDQMPCGCVPHKTRMTQWGFRCDTEDQPYCNFECPHEEEN